MNPLEQPVVMTLGQPYPIPFPKGFGAAAQFLSTGGNILQVIIPDMRADEVEALRSSRLRAGFLREDSAILLMFEFSNPQGQPILIFDCPFDLRRVSSEHWELPDLDEPLKTRMLIQVHGIDGGGILRSLRGVTLSPELTGNFLAAVMDQVASITPSQPAIERWQQLDPHLLLKMTRMSECGQ